MENASLLFFLFVCFNDFLCSFWIVKSNFIKSLTGAIEAKPDAFSVSAKMLMWDQPELLDDAGAVSAPVAEAMASGARKVLHADVAVSVTGLAGPTGDEYGNPVGTVYIGYSDLVQTVSVCYHFDGDRDQVRRQATEAALRMILKYNA